MDKRAKLAVGASSLAVAATMFSPTSASAGDACIPPFCPEPGDQAFVKIADSFDRLFFKLETVEAPEAVFVKITDVFTKITDVFTKI